MSLLSVALYIVFVLAAIVLVVVILLQEGKGGGLTDALGTSGQQTFGVGASGINKFTGWVGGIFLASALGIHVVNRMDLGTSMPEQWGQPIQQPTDGSAVQPATPGESGTPPANGGQPSPAQPPAQPATPPEQPKQGG